MSKSLNFIRVGSHVVHRDEIRRQLAAEVQQLVAHLECAKEASRPGTSLAIESYEAMIQDRANLLARLSSRTPC